MRTRATAPPPQWILANAYPHQPVQAAGKLGLCGKYCWNLMDGTGARIAYGCSKKTVQRSVGHGSSNVKSFEKDYAAVVRFTFHILPFTVRKNAAGGLVAYPAKASTLTIRNAAQSTA